MFVNRVSKFSVVVIAGMLLDACGGGGGGGGSSSSPTPSTIAFPVAQAHSQMTINGYSVTFAISGKSSGVAVSGSGTLTVGAAVAATFEGQAGMSTTESLSATVTGNGQSIPINVTGIDYFDSNYNDLAYLDNTDGSLTVVDPVVPVPSTVHVGDSGSLGAATTYSDSTKSTVINTETLTYNVVADTATSILFKVTKKTYDLSHNLTDTDITSIRVTENGVGTWASESDTTSDGVQLTFTPQ